MKTAKSLKFTHLRSLTLVSVCVLREMCVPSRYMVIEDVLSLPSQLPKIYQRHIRAQELEMIIWLKIDH